MEGEIIIFTDENLKIIPACHELTMSEHQIMAGSTSRGPLRHRLFYSFRFSIDRVIENFGGQKNNSKPSGYSFPEFFDTHLQIDCSLEH
jgi:hypothetical protein